MASTTAATEPETTLDERYSIPGAVATAWSEVRLVLETAQIFWISTVRPGDRPHVTPLLAIWLDDALCFCTGRRERKAANLAANPDCVLTTGSNAFASGLDVVVEGRAVELRDPRRLQRLSDAYVARYGEEWRFEVQADGTVDSDGATIVYEVPPATVFAFRKGQFSQTRYRFERAD